MNRTFYELKSAILFGRTGSIPIRWWKKRLVAALILWAATPGLAATWYVDGAANGAGNGKSWTDAWKTVQAVSGVASGDTVYISQGTYNVNGGWTPPSAKYQTGQESGHNGIVILDGGGNGFLLRPNGNTTFSGQVGTDTAHHMKFQNHWDACLYWDSGTIAGVRVSYVDAPSVNRFVYMGNSASVTNFEVDHCTIHKKYGGSPSSLDDVFYQGGLRGGAKYHDNLVEATCNNAQTPYGADIWKWGDGFDVYNNHVRVVLDSGYPSGEPQQHADVFQVSGNDIKIYSNWFENIGESVVFDDHFGSTGKSMSHVWFYNNVVTQSFPPGIAQVARGLDFEPQDSSHTSTFTDVIIANNVFANITTLFVHRLHQAAKWTGCRFVNNLYFNNNDASQSSWDSTAKSQVEYAANSIAQANWFVDAAKNDFHLATGSPAIGAGVTVSQFSTDKDGKPRTLPWSQGPYVTTGTPQPTPSPSAPPPPVAVSDGTKISVGFGSYPVTVTQAGDYILNTEVLADDTARNSIWLDFDSDPTNDDSRCFDIPVTVATNFQTLPASWRGTSTTPIPADAQFNPKVWSLPLGTHTLKIVEREPAQIKSVTFSLSTPHPTPSPTPPQPTPTPPQPTPTPSPSASPTPPPNQAWDGYIKQLTDQISNWMKANPFKP